LYAVIRAGGKQHKVAAGDVIRIERLQDGEERVEFTPLVVVNDEGETTAGRERLQNAKVTARVLGQGKAPKVDVFKYRSKVGYRRSYGHRQPYTTIEISGIEL
jgi:large subunit ribosomal protein L21